MNTVQNEMDSFVPFVSASIALLMQSSNATIATSPARMPSGRSSQAVRLRSSEYSAIATTTLGKPKIATNRMTEARSSAARSSEMMNNVITIAQAVVFTVKNTIRHGNAFRDRATGGAMISFVRPTGNPGA